MTDAVDDVLSGYPGLQAAQEALYKDLHAAELEKRGCAMQSGIGGTGVVGVLANGDGPTVLLRAELDAAAFTAHFGQDALDIPKQTVSEDFGLIPPPPCSCRRCSPPSGPAPRPWWWRP